MIILNGVSSAGKTTLAKELQDRLPEPYFHIDVDAFCNMAPAKFNVDNYSVQSQFVENMFHVVKLFSDMGFNLIVPCIFLEGGDFLARCVELLHQYPVLLAHVKCPAEELERREKERGDRKVGEAKEMIPFIVPKSNYDVEVDTYKFSIEECADKIA